MFLLQASVGHQIWPETVADWWSGFEDRTAVLPLLVSISDDCFWPNATKSGRPYGVTSASSLSWRTPTPDPKIPLTPVPTPDPETPPLTLTMMIKWRVLSCDTIESRRSAFTLTKRTCCHGWAHVLMTANRNFSPDKERRESGNYKGLMEAGADSWAPNWASLDYVFSLKVRNYVHLKAVMSLCLASKG